MKKNLEISLRYANQANGIMSEIIRQMKYEDIAIEQTSSNTYEWDSEEDEEADFIAEDSIIEEFENAGIPASEYVITDEF